MPELPEVETVVRGLAETVVGRTIAKVRLNAPGNSIVVGAGVGSQRLDKALIGRTILRSERRGKNILLELSGDATLWVHLKMTGHLFYKKRNEPVDKHDLVIFDFEPLNGAAIRNKYHLRFNDYRRFGRLRLFSNNELWSQPGLADLGPEPLKITEQSFLDLLKRGRRMIKPALLDQTFIAGIGNIYADESLYLARLHPCRLTSSISRCKATELRRHIQAILRKSISLMGTSVDSYSGVYGQSGSFQKYLLAYGNEGLPCGRCNRKIVRKKIGSRSAHYCPKCQRL